MGDILTENDFDQVRNLLGGVEEDLLPDSVLSSFVFLSFLEAKVKDMFPTWAAIKSSASDDWTYLKTGTACSLAAMASAYLQTSQSGGSFSIGSYSESGVRDINWEFGRENLIERAKEAFGLISTYTYTRRKVLVVSGPTSEGANEPEDWEDWEDKIIPPIIDWYDEDD